MEHYVKNGDVKIWTEINGVKITNMSSYAAVVRATMTISGPFHK